MTDFKLIHISYGNVFLYKGVTMDWHDYLGPTIYRRNTDTERNYKNVSGRIWALVGQFGRMDKKDREQYRIF